MGSLSSSNQTWQGFGNGALQSGVDASGSGVSIQYISSCAKAVAPSATQTTSSSSSTSQTQGPSQGSGHTGSSAIVFPFDTAVTHKALSPVSVALLLISVIVYRISLQSTTSSLTPKGGLILTGLSISIFVMAFAVGVAGIAAAFSTITSTSGSGTVLKRSTHSGVQLKTGHGKAGLAFFVLLYGTMALVLASAMFSSKPSSKAAPEPESTDEKDPFPAVTSRQSSTPNDPDSPVGETRVRTRSWASSYLWPGRAGGKLGRKSSESAAESEASAVPTRSFEVLNRGGPRARRPSMPGFTIGNPSESGHRGALSQSLSDLNWLDRRRSVNAVVSAYSVSPSP